MNHTESQKEQFSPEMLAQMRDVFQQLENKLILKLYLDQRTVSQELKDYIGAMVEQSDKLSLQVETDSNATHSAPCVELCHADGTGTGLAFHGLPAGHEFASFLKGIAHASAREQEIEESLKKRIAALKTPLDIKVLVTLTCPMCPDLVIAAQQLAAARSGVMAHVYDVQLFEALARKYNVMSVPCLVVNDERVSFGRKNLKELLDWIEQ